MRHGLAFALLLTAASAAHASFDPVAFFQGRSHGDGRLKVILQSAKSVRVDSRGRVEPDGSLLLSQRVDQQGEAVRTRTWRLTRISPTRFQGSLTDATGPVTVDLVGRGALIRYRMKNNMQVEQTLTPMGPRVVQNSMRVSRLGVTVAHLDETIRKLD
ncbi:DUF3833 family protein [Sphingomonas ginkgonis]|uniref:DUF3833 family protein n=1 Tax=Sphingomonas ginkgonis TaxID=2315330 RepID=A0A3R9YN66_9SPHN|nr:DUF3833 family protein [Sphingomonas ginkgonis]RST31636.1 DUF3833 family protein [Sphingomonas ginkgonis]